MRRIGLIAVLGALLMGAWVRAQVLAPSVPADALVYIGWQGEQELGNDYAQSHLKAILDASQLREVFSDFLPRVLERIGREQRDAKPVLNLISSLAQPMCQYNTAIYFGGVDLSDPENPTPRLAILIEAKDGADALAQRLQQQIDLVVRGGNMPFPFTAAAQGGVVMVVLGDLAEEIGGTLSADAGFTSTMAKLQGQPVIAAYVNVEGLVAMVDNLVQTYNANDAEEWAAIRDALGLRGIQRVGYTGGFDGQDWSERAFVAAPAPRKGVASLLDRSPLEEQTLRLIPKDATYAVAGRADLAGLLRNVLDGIQAADPDARQRVEEGLSQMRQVLGMDIQADLLEPLGDQWVMYTASSVGGNGLLGHTLVNRADDAARVDESMWKLAQLATAVIAQQINDDDVRIEFRQMEADGGKVQYLAIPLVSPAWTVRNGNLYVGLYPQVVVSAAAYDSQASGSILDNPTYRAVMTRLDAPQVSGMQFIDVSRRLPETYGVGLLGSRLYLGLADIFGVQAPPLALPPLHVLLQHASPAASVSWADDEGFYIRAIQPFPGSAALANGDITSATIGQQSLMISILLPSLNRSRETANRVKCASNMRQMGQALLLYSIEHRQRYPKTLGELVTTQDLGIDVFTCPSGNVEYPFDLRQAPIEQQAQWVTDHAPYVFLAPPNANVPPDIVVIHEAFDNHGGGGINVLFGDGHVEFVPMPRAREAIERSKQWIEQRRGGGAGR